VGQIVGLVCARVNGIPTLVAFLQSELLAVGKQLFVTTLSSLQEIAPNFRVLGDYSLPLLEKSATRRSGRRHSGAAPAAGSSLGGLAVTPTGTSNRNFFLYAADPQAKTVRAFTIDGNTGALSPVPGSPFPAGNAPMLLTVATSP
jgi:hypothetical protein